MDPSFRMKLACVRCKRKKIKCDRATPSCHQCVTAHADCQYVERRQRPRLAQQRVAVQNLNQRLEQLERQISHTNDSPPTSLASTSNIEISPVPSPKASLNATDGHESWVYQLANDTRRNFQIQATPEATPKGRIDDAMASLNEALDDLGKIRVRPDTIGADFTLSPEESKACIDAFLHLLASQVCPETFTDAVDFNLLYALPSIIQSPYINIEPGVHVLYYNALHFGLQQIRGPHDPLVRAAYLKIMEAVPAWLESSGDSEMDGHTASLTSWTALVNWDYQLSWKFHLKSCQHIKMKGIDHIDVVPARTFEEETKRDQHRFLYWHVLSTDSLYRLFSGKPTVMRWVPNKVRPPALFRPTQMHPSAAQVITSAIWIRYTVMTAEMINYLDDEAAKNTDEVTCDKVHQFCLDLEALMDEFKMEAMMEDESNPVDFRGLIADHMMNVYSIIIGVKRLVNKISQRHQVDEVTIRAARSVVCIIIAFSTDTKMDDKVKSIFDHFVTFYPFCAVFSLYEYVLACKDPDDCEDDIRSLEDIAEAMTRVSVHRRGFLPFAKTINAMNRVVRSFSEERRKSRPATAEGEGIHSSSEGGNIAASNLDTFQNIVASELDQFDPATMAQLPDFSMGADGDFHPFGFVRAVENDFQSRNWHENWWDINGTAENMTGLDENGNIQGAQYGFPTPSTT